MNEQLNIGKAGEWIQSPDSHYLTETGKLKLKHIGEQKVRPRQKHKFLIPLLSLFLVCSVGLAGYFYMSQEKDTAVVQTLSTSEQTAVSKFTAELEKIAIETGVPYKVTTQVLAGGYVLGLTTYNPDDPNNLYIDYSLAKPETTVDEATDDTAQSIKKELASQLPVINETITVKDKAKVSMETYKKAEGLYQTILLYDGKPFAYVETDENNVHTNYVTNYYVSDVAVD